MDFDNRFYVLCILFYILLVRLCNEFYETGDSKQFLRSTCVKCLFFVVIFCYHYHCDMKLLIKINVYLMNDRSNIQLVIILINNVQFIGLKVTVSRNYYSYCARYELMNIAHVLSV